MGQSHQSEACQASYGEAVRKVKMVDEVDEGIGDLGVAKVVIRVSSLGVMV